MVSELHMDNMNDCNKLCMMTKVVIDTTKWVDHDRGQPRVVKLSIENVCLSTCTIQGDREGVIQLECPIFSAA